MQLNSVPLTSTGQSPFFGVYGREKAQTDDEHRVLFDVNPEQVPVLANHILFWWWTNFSFQLEIRPPPKIGGERITDLIWKMVRWGPNFISGSNTRSRARARSVGLALPFELTSSLFELKFFCMVASNKHFNKRNRGRIATNHFAFWQRMNFLFHLEIRPPPKICSERITHSIPKMIGCEPFAIFSGERNSNDPCTPILF